MAVSLMAASKPISSLKGVMAFRSTLNISTCHLCFINPNFPAYFASVFRGEVSS